MHIMRTSAGRLAYEDIGTGPTVVLLHATLHDHHDFDPILPALAAEHRVIAIDWPGHGASEPNSTITAAAIADTLAEVVTTLELEPAVFIGSSVGGFAAARLALEQPARVAGLVLVNTGGFVRQTPLTRAYCNFYGSHLMARRWLPHSIRNYMKPVTPHDDAVVERAIRVASTDIGRATYSALWHSFNDPRYDLTGRATEIAAPTLIVWGRRDPVLPLRYGRKAHALITGSELQVLPTGHLPFSSAPEQFLDVVRPFIESAYATPGASPSTK
ncbi:alpha/beta fold hydrolase [Nocardia sp. NPDC004123]